LGDGRWVYRFSGDELAGHVHRALNVQGKPIYG
jgi:hypothetical protein